ncbi:RloB family protein [Desulfogranum mediterraneum]|uniref:RloB family protein n=1 Tax=Desulfogranum mediterraneum TaxID=160661 RepID=UPI00048BA0E5|nr:RloB family protein [Desulfogranum mediterraneum]
MAKKRRSFSRKAPDRSYRKRFVIATEGKETEPQYFSMFNSKRSTIQVMVLKSKQKTSSGQVLDRLKKADIGKKDSAWIVIDRDTWEKQELDQVFDSCKAQGYKMALSNPMFEYWILLHFEDGNGVNTGNVKKRLTIQLPHFSKSNVEIHKIKPGIDEAIRRAERKDNPPCEKWPLTTGTTVYRLVKELQE